MCGSNRIVTLAEGAKGRCFIDLGLPPLQQAPDPSEPDGALDGSDETDHVTLTEEEVQPCCEQIFKLTKRPFKLVVENTVTNKRQEVDFLPLPSTENGAIDDLILSTLLDDARQHLLSHPPQSPIKVVFDYAPKPTLEPQWVPAGIYIIIIMHTLLYSCGKCAVGVEMAGVDEHRSIFLDFVKNVMPLHWQPAEGKTACSI